MLSSIGADIVVWEQYLHTADFYDLISDLPQPKLALNCVGGRVATDMARALGPNGTLVTYGNLSKEPVKLPASLVKSRKISSEDFSLAYWYKNSKASEQHAHITISRCIYDAPCPCLHCQFIADSRLRRDVQDTS